MSLGKEVAGFHGESWRIQGGVPPRGWWGEEAWSPWWAVSGAQAERDLQGPGVRACEMGNLGFSGCQREEVGPLLSQERWLLNPASLWAWAV